MFGFGRKRARQPQGPRDRRAYAIGDVHGRDDLLEALLADVERDLAERPVAETYLVFLGDLIDRGPNSREVVERLRTYRREGVNTVFLLGNHEEALLRLLAGEPGLLANWLRFGGKACVRSYGLRPKRLAAMTEEKAVETLRAAIPREHVEFLRSFADTFRFGDYLFVHAGIRPGVELALQTQLDLRWIRRPFLDDDSDHGFVVVHGHTISDGVDERHNRIGIDTGAYATGVLTALVVEGTERRFLSTGTAAAAEQQAAAE